MPTTPDRQPGSGLEDDGLILEPAVTTPTQNGEIRYVTSVGFQFREEGVTKSLTGTGLSESAHEVLDSLVHELSETSYGEVTRDVNGKIQDWTVWTSSAKTTKVRELNLTRTSGRLSQFVWKQYNGSGTLTQTLTGVITRDGQNRIQSIAYTES